ncbi:P-loop containing nucleoside triphosphate hydrolase protein [Amanita rubescens]|nr:P-loop containing nucleoside triphosphate hydrolase protein [Amanita rubescens]
MRPGFIPKHLQKRPFSTSAGAALRRSYLYVPSTSDRMLDTSLVINSDVIIYDLEDSVPPLPIDKTNARIRLSNFLLGLQQKQFSNVQRNAVRINDVTTPFFRDDVLEIASSSSIRALVVPKVHSTNDLDAVSRELHKAFKNSPREEPIRIIPSVESAKAMWNLGSIASWKSKYGALSGGVLSALLARTPSRRELLYTRSQIVIAAKAFGLEAIDMVCINYKDFVILEDECKDGRQLGFTGKLTISQQAIHPAQVGIIQSTFVPTSHEIERAAKILHAMKIAHGAEKGAIGLEGEMIDAPMIKQAEKVIQVAEAAGLSIPQFFFPLHNSFAVVSMSSSLERFVSDNCLRFLGVSNKTTADFVLASVTSAKNPENAFSTLHNFGLPDTPDAHQFVAELFEKAPRRHKHKSTADAARKQAEKEAKALRSQKFGLVLGEESANDIVHIVKKDKGKEKRDRHIRKRDYDAKEWESDEEEKARKRRKGDDEREKEAEVEAEMEAPEDGDARRERERLQDLKERDEFAERMRERDKQKTKKVVEDRSSKATGAAAEAAIRRQLAEDTDARETALPSLRQHSRQEYLTKREIQQIELLRKEIQDEEILFSGMKVSKRERENFDRKKELLRLVEERLKINDKWEGYQLPEDYLTEQGKIDKKKKENALYKRYEDAKPKDDQFVTDVDQWEASQTHHSTFKVGAMDKKDIIDDYEYVFDESQTIKFVMEATLPGANMSAADRLLQAQIDAAEKRAKTIEETRKSLPIYAYRQELIDAVKEHQVLIVVAETGSGKTTQLPQYLHEAGFTAGGVKVGCTQPRRVAAMSVAARVAEEMGTKVGYEVGYSIRFEDCTSDKTVIKYMTDEPDLAGYSVIIIDEAHERTLSTDILFALVKDIARFRPELRVLISSATMDAEKFSEYFDNAPTFYIPGRMYPVDIHYTPQPEANYLHAAITTVFQIHTTQPKGDILVFLTSEVVQGQEEIEACHENLQETARALGNKVKELIICPIYANLPSEMQAKIFEPTPEGARKVVLATNIAETSITIDGVVFVIDPGFVKQNSYNPRTGMSSLVIVPCSRASANQRAGRAGRVGPGKSFRLYTKWAFNNELEANTVPEIQRTNLGMVVLLLKSLGINDLIKFEFIDPPPTETLMRALELLYALGALNDKGELTKLGRRMAEFPVDPMLSKAIISSEDYQCTDEVLTIISMLSESGSLFYRPKDKKMHADQARQNFVRAGGDHFTLLNIWEQWADTNYSQQFCYEQFLQFKSLSRARDIRDQLAGLCERVEIVIQSNPNSNDITPIQKAITAGYFYNTVVQDFVTKFPHQPPVKTMLYYELVMTTKSYMRQVMEIKPAWLMEVAPHYFKAADLEQLATGDKKMPKAIGASGNGGS